MIQPSCPALLVLDDDAFRKSLIATMDQQHFMVTSVDENQFAAELERRKYRVIVVGLDLSDNKGASALEFLKEHREISRCGVIIVGESDPRIRSYAPWADETLMKPVDPQYLATRARAYCGC
jgi:DNA-binding response OmpR family regulator